MLNSWTLIPSSKFTAHTAEDITLKIYSNKDVWLPIVRDESLISEWEETNEYGRNIVSRMFDASISKKIVGYVLFNWSTLYWPPDTCSFQTIVFASFLTEKWVNVSAGFCLEIPIDYIFDTGSRVTIWLKKTYRNYITH